MTREEAIEKLEAFAPMVVDDTREALDMAIEALQEPTITRCKDCFFEECKAKEFYGENGFCSIGARKRKDKMKGQEE